jgi:hypothetical protein
MIVFESMLVDAATEAGMKIPPDPESYVPNDYPHFHVFCRVQMNRPVTWGNHWNNARIIAAVPEEEIRTVTEDQLTARGFHP